MFAGVVRSSRNTDMSKTTACSYWASSIRSKEGIRGGGCLPLRGREVGQHGSMLKGGCIVSFSGDTCVREERGERDGASGETPAGSVQTAITRVVQLCRSVREKEDIGIWRILSDLELYLKTRFYVY